MNSLDSLHHDDVASQIQRTTAEPAPLTAWRQLSLSALWLGVNAISAALLPIVLPIQIVLLAPGDTVGGAQQAEFLGWLSALGAVVALAVPPLVGALSDRTPLRMGRRRPFLLIGVAISVVGAWALARPTDLHSLTLAFLILQLGFNVAVGAYQGLLPDLTPENQRGAASGYLGFMTILGNIGSLALAGLLFAGLSLANVSSASGRAQIISGSSIFYAATAIALVVTTVITVVWTSETPLSAAEAAALGAAPRAASQWERRLQQVRALWLDPWKSHNFTWVFLTRALVMLGLTLFLTFIEYYFANVAHVTSFASATALVAGLALAGAIVSALALGILSDYMNRATLVGVSSALMAIPAVIALMDRIYHQTALGYQVIFALAAIFLALGALFVSFIQGEPGVAARQHPHQPGSGWRFAATSHSGRARGFLRFWPVWERIYGLFLPTKPIPHAPHGLLATHISRYRGN